MRARFVPVLAVACGLLVASCSPSEEPTPMPTAVETTASPTPTETPTPTATPTPTPTPIDPQTVNIEAAKQTVLDYVADSNALSIAGYVGWEARMAKYWGAPELMALYGEFYRSAEEEGARAEGASTVGDIALLEYRADPTGAGFDQVDLEYCSDNSAVTHFARDGSTIEKNAPSRFVYEVRLQRQQDGRWTFTELTALTARLC